MPRSRLVLAGALAGLALVVAVVVAITVGGDGSGGAPATVPTFSATQAPPPGGTRDAAIIQAWADTLAQSDVAGATSYFAVPAIVQPDPTEPGVRLTRRAQIRHFNAALACGAMLLETAPHGRYTIATFRLIERPNHNCDAPGATATTAFLIRDGLIAEWRRVPNVEPAPTA